MKCFFCGDAELVKLGDAGLKAGVEREVWQCPKCFEVWVHNPRSDKWLSEWHGDTEVFGSRLDDHLQ